MPLGTEIRKEVCELITLHWASMGWIFFSFARKIGDLYSALETEFQRGFTLKNENVGKILQTSAMHRLGVGVSGAAKRSSNTNVQLSQNDRTSSSYLESADRCSR